MASVRDSWACWLSCCSCNTTGHERIECIYVKGDRVAEDEKLLYYCCMQQVQCSEQYDVKCSASATVHSSNLWAAARFGFLPSIVDYRTNGSLCRQAIRSERGRKGSIVAEYPSSRLRGLEMVAYSTIFIITTYSNLLGKITKL